MIQTKKTLIITVMLSSQKIVPTATLEKPVGQSLQWFRSNTWDSFWLQCVYWILPLATMIYFSIGGDTLLFIVASIFVLVRLAHGYFSTYMCVAHPAYREVAKKNIWRFYGIPALITLFFVIYFLLPQTIFPHDTYSRLEIYYFFAFPYIYVHYAGQHIGILSVYRARAKQELSPFHKKFDKIYCHVVTSFTLTALNLNNFYDHKLGDFTYGQLFLTRFINWNAIAWVIVVSMTVLYIYLELKTSRRSYQKIFYAISISLLSLVLTLDDFLFAWILVHMQHYFSHFGLCGHILNKIDSSNNKKQNSSPLLKHYGILVFISVFLAVIHYHYQIVGSVSGRYDRIFKDIIPLADANSTIRLLILGLFVGLGICHYYYDRLAFKISDPEIGAVLKKYL